MCVLGGRGDGVLELAPPDSFLAPCFALLREVVSIPTACLPLSLSRLSCTCCLRFAPTLARSSMVKLEVIRSRAGALNKGVSCCRFGSGFTAESRTGPSRSAGSEEQVSAASTVPSDSEQSKYQRHAETAWLQTTRSPTHETQNDSMITFRSKDLSTASP